MRDLDTDLVIAGAGLAGLSLAVALLDHGPPGWHLTVVDPRTDWPRDRTWCHWEVDDLAHPFTSCIDHRWPTWRVRDASREAIAGSRRHPYCHVPSDALYALALERLADSRRATVVSGCTVDDHCRLGDGVAVATGQGDIRARMLFDSRPLAEHLPERRAGDVALLQHFRGVVVRTPTPCFDAGRVELMDFDVDQGHGLAFVYVLPYARDQALVEATWFSPALHEAHVYEAMIDDWLERHAVARDRCEIVEREQGVIPMTTARFESPEPARGVVRIGLGGGLARPSTGYAFLAIQRHSRALATALCAHPERVPSIAPRARRTELLDGVFLDWLAAHPEQAPSVFVDMFEQVRPEHLVRFLSEAGSLREIAAVVRACPSLAFMGAALRRAVEFRRH